MSEQDSDPDIEEILVRFDPYIVTEVEKLVRRSSNVFHPEVLDLEIDEIIQRVRIKLWGVLKKERHIEYPKAYISRIVKNEFNDIMRRRKPLLPLPTDEDGELYMGNVLLSESGGLGDPAVEFGKEEELDEWIALTADVVSDLPARQQHAMICHLKEQVENGIRLVEAFEKYKINIAALQWPEDEADTKRLKASISPARHTIARRVGLNLSEYKKWGISDTLLLLYADEETKEL